jgi:enterochelin esterase family protein
VFGKVISQSGAFQWWPEGDTEDEWLARKFVDARTGPVEFYLDAGILEVGAWRPGSPSLLVANRHLRDVLRAKGYTVHYKEFNGGHNYIIWQGTLADELVALLGSES